MELMENIPEENKKMSKTKIWLIIVLVLIS